MEKGKFMTLLGLELPPLGRPACCQSLYRLSYVKVLNECGGKTLFILKLEIDAV
jgi:hypothetical protein